MTCYGLDRVAVVGRCHTDAGLESTAILTKEQNSTICRPLTNRCTQKSFRRIFCLQRIAFIQH